MAEATLPDVMPPVRATVAADAAVVAEFADRVYVDTLPAGPAWPVLLLTGVVHTPGIGWTDHRVIARVTVEAFGRDERDTAGARRGAALGLAAVRDLAGYRDADLEVSGVEAATGIRPLPPDEHRVARAGVDVRVHAHRTYA